MIAQLSAVWQEFVTTFLAESNDSITVHYKPVRTGSDPSYDGFFDESTNSASPSDISGAVTVTPDPVDVAGKFHSDLYGNSMSSGEEIQHLAVGNFSQADAVFSCLLSEVITDDVMRSTIFDGAEYIVESVSNRRYQIIATKFRGLGAPFICDLFLRASNI